MPEIADLRQALIDVGRRFDARGWVAAGGGNFSARLDARTALVTASGPHKGLLTPGDFVAVDIDSGTCNAGKPSYETGLHLAVYRRLPDVGAVLHTHGPAATRISRRDGKNVVLRGYEVQKALPGAPDPARTCTVPVFDNDQDIARLAGRLETRLRSEPLLAGCLIAGHGLYAWGTTVAQARNRVEALEFMFQCELDEEQVKP
ncbi:MAG: methylthioribulose 1-phosphate dehydratase [Nevskiaceae bacterium]|nr:MAG: methylthioribulose 1-phosphate dehydratase [Nevskiaceae bacterium]TBR72618.1 MAG: methylthioribulose 1-phosphate dehydratase [Nevskiaceae bacterium]